MINFDAQNRIFTLDNGSISYIMGLFEDNYLGHLHFGPSFRHFNAKRAFYQTEREGAPQPWDLVAARTFSLDLLPQEYPAPGCGDYRIPALEAVLPSGQDSLDLRYVSHEIFKGRKPLANLPSIRGGSDDCETLEITMREVAGELEVVLSFTIYQHFDVITRHARIRNCSGSLITLNRAASMAIDLPEADYERISMYGRHGYERQILRTPLHQGIETASSVRGATSHQHQNFIALVRPHTDELQGEAMAFTLVWSGNHECAVERSPYDNTRVVLGINPQGFAWQLHPGDCFTTPEAVLVYSACGLNHLSQQFHGIIREHVLPGSWAKKLRPVLVNSWEAAYMDFTEDSIVKFAETAVGLGAELIVLDDGWFGCRDKDNCSLGDWTEVSTRKLPHGLKGLSERIHALGAMFGLWMEPEMVSPNSNLFRAHPEWALGTVGHKRSQQREQCVLDLSRQDVRDYVVDSICQVLSSAQIDYVKWDMNRNLTEIGSAAFPASQQQEIATRYVFGVYDIMRRITGALPNILFESCAGGGRRFDLGTLCYMPQTWTSDDTDEVLRQRIQYGTSFYAPPITMGSHVSAVPNHQVGRITPMLSRFLCAASGNFGYEMDLGRLSAAEQEEVRGHIALYKKLRPTLQFGTFYRLISPFERDQDECAWNFISQDGSEVVMMYFRNLCQPHAPVRKVRLAGLEPDALYEVTEHLLPTSIACNTIDYLSTYNLKGDVFSGAELMHFGLSMDKVDADFAAYLLVFRRKD